LYLLKDIQSKDIDIYCLSPISSNKYSSNTEMISTEIISTEVKHIKLDKLVIRIGKKWNSNLDYEIFNIIKKELDNKYIKIASEFGKLNRENSKYFDIDNINITENEIVSKLNHINSVIKSSFSDSDYDAWLLSNHQTFNHIYSKIQKKSMWNTKCEFGKFTIGNMIYIINDLVEDGMIIIGKSECIICHILTDANGNIVFEQRENDNDIELTMYFSFVSKYYSPESRYFYISTRNIRYYRKKKLQKIQKIRELYGKN
jgi:hypothetical protein